MQVSPIDVQKHLRGVSYPAAKEELVAAARENGAPDDIVDALQSVSDDRFDSPADVMEALGKSG